ncbi:MAG: hypothetical protein K9N38_01970 [Candidatus Marinimicrobia bacterium]|nr:hypothetical protein [Candidatus Neomarinimicrobiota bacterium]MCF7850191.1 hypothetical protein [Candidatus Neomarinimicrobiota bacterium]
MKIKKILRDRYYTQAYRLRIKKWLRSPGTYAPLDDTNYRLITGMGRSGTKFLSGLINKSTDAVSHHEPGRFDRYAGVNSYSNEDQGNFLKFQKTPEINSILHDNSGMVYCEVNSYLRNMHLQVSQLITNNIYFIIRNPVDTIISILNRDTFTHKDAFGTDIGQQLACGKNNRLTAVCNYWNSYYSSITELNRPVIYLESITTQYQKYLELCQSLGITPINEEAFIVIKDRKVNITKRAVPFSKEDLQQNEWDTILSICGDTAETFGYTI